jgi:membrane protease YdiL (CAAX protease family)
MATAVMTQNVPERIRGIAAPLHPVLVIAAQATLSYIGKIHTDEQRLTGTLNRVHVYDRTIIVEWLLLGLVVAGVLLHGSPVAAVLGERWRSVKHLISDLGIGLAFLVVSIAVLSVLSGHGKGPDAATSFLLPQTQFERTLWIIMALTAGICEEALFRGYFQRQFMALTNSAAVGIGLSAVAFGAAHAYQGWRHAIQIALLGAMLGGLAFWRKSLRPGMISHATQDVLAILVRH